MERCVQRLWTGCGVVSAGLAGERLVVVLRNLCIVRTRSDGVDAFREDALIYTRIVALPRKGRMSTWINRASFSLHAWSVSSSGAIVRLGRISFPPSMPRRWQCFAMPWTAR